MCVYMYVGVSVCCRVPYLLHERGLRQRDRQRRRKGRVPQPLHCQDGSDATRNVRADHHEVDSRLRHVKGYV